METDWGYFSEGTEISKILAANESNKDGLFFYEVTKWALNPTTGTQQKNWISLSTYLSDGTHYCTLLANRFAVHPNRMGDINSTHFKGRDPANIHLQRGDKCWHYDKQLHFLSET